MLAPTNFCDARRHHCILGHLYEHHRPPDHYFLDQVRGRCIGMLNVRSQQGSGCEKMKKKPKILEMNGSDPKETEKMKKEKETKQKQEIKHKQI